MSCEHPAFKTWDTPHMAGMRCVLCGLDILDWNADLRARLDEAKRAFDVSDAARTELAARLDVTNQAMALQQETCRAMQAGMQEMQTRLEDVINERDLLRNSRDGWTRRDIERADEIALLKDRLEAAEQDYKDCEEGRRADLAAWNEAEDTLRKQRDEARALSLQAADAFERTTCELTDVVRQLEAEREGRRADHDGLTAQCAVRDQARVEAERERDEAQAKVTILRNSCADDRRKLEAAEKRAAALRVQFEKYETRLKAAERELDVARRELKDCSEVSFQRGRKLEAAREAAEKLRGLAYIDEIVAALDGKETKP